MGVLELFSLRGKVALVTGGNRGIGFGMGKALAEAGAVVAFSASREDTMARGMADYRKAGLDAHGYVCDIRDEDAVRRVVADIEKELGQLDILVNNAGIIKRSPLHEMSTEDFREVVDINLVAQFVVAKAVIPGMLVRGGGKIINTCSVLSEAGRGMVGAYSAAKGGLRNLTKSIAAEYGDSGIYCNGIGPGFIATELTEDLRYNPDGSPTPFDSFIRHRVPMGRWGATEDLSGATVFLASAASDYVNGHILYVDGGLLGSLGKPQA